MTLVSRVLGLVREQVFAALARRRLLLGRLPDRLPHPEPAARPVRRGRALGGVRAHLRRARRRSRAREGAFRLANRVLTLLAVVLGGARRARDRLRARSSAALAPGFEKEAGKAELTVAADAGHDAVPAARLLRRGRDGHAERGGALRRPGALAGALQPRHDRLGRACCGRWACRRSRSSLGWAVGTLLGGLAQFAVQVPSLWRAGWRFRPEWAPRDPALRGWRGLMAPATVGLAAVQVNIFVNSSSPRTTPGAVSWLDYAFRLLYLPIGLFGVALGTIATAGLARRAAEGDTGGPAPHAAPDAVDARVPHRARERGADGARRADHPPASTSTAASPPPTRCATAAALFLYSLGLVGYTGVKVLAPAFYALGRSRVPLVAQRCSRSRRTC